MYALSWMNAHWNKCTCVFFSERVSSNKPYIFFPGVQGHSFGQLSYLQVPKCVGLLAFWTSAFWCGKTVLSEKTPGAAKMCLFGNDTFSSSHLHRHILWSFFSEPLCRFWARNRSLFEVSVSILMPTFSGVQGQSSASQDEISEG